MSGVVPVLQAIVRHELAASRGLAIGSVTATTTNEDGSGDHNLEVNVRLHGSELELQRLPVTVGRLGMSVAPLVGDLAVVGFVDGDVNGGVVLGFLYDDRKHPPDAKPGELVYEVPDDPSGAIRCEMRLPNGNTLTVVDERVTVKMGDSTLIVESNGDITLDAAKNLKLRAAMDIVLEAGTNIALDAGTNLALDAGTNLDAKAGINASLQGTVEAKVKGQVTTIAGLTTFSAG